MSINIYNICVRESLVIKTYSNDVLIATTSLRATDRDDESISLIPAQGKLTANLVVSGKLAGSWDTTWHVAPSVANLPDKMEVYADGTLTDTWTGVNEDGNIFTSDAEKADYIALEGVYKAASVTSGETVTYYTTLQAAIDAAQSGDTVTVLTDIELTEGVTVAADDQITLDLNGKTITGKPAEAAAYAVITNKGALTITDSTTEKNGAIVCASEQTPSTAYAVNTITNGGNLIIEAGTISNVGTGNQIGYAIDNNSGNANAVVTINGGTVTASGSSYYDGIRQFCNSLTNENSVTITNGTVSSIWLQNPSDGASDRNTKDVKGSVNISGGTVNALYLEPSTGFSGSITDGNIGSVSAFETAEGRDLTGFISGGTFTNKPDNALAIEGYMFKQNSDGTYGVQEIFEAELNDMKYKTVEEALEASDAGDTIIILEDFQGGSRFINKVVTIDVTNYPDAASLMMPSSGFKKAVDSENSNLLHFVETNVVAKIGDVEYESLADALAAAAGMESASIVIVKDFESAPITVNGNVSIDFNGHTVTIVGTENTESGVTVAANAALLLNSANNGGFVFDSAVETGITVEAGGTLTVAGGSYVFTQDNVINNGTLNITGGVFYDTDGKLVTTGANANITGGVFDTKITDTVADGYTLVACGYAADGTTESMYAVVKGNIGTTVTETPVAQAYDVNGELLHDAEAILGLNAAIDLVKTNGGTVKLVENAETSMLMVPAGVTLDLNGKTLTANQVIAFGHITDGDGKSGNGKIVVDEKNLAIFENTQLPVYVNNGYCFLSYAFGTRVTQATAAGYDYTYTITISNNYPALKNLLKDGGSVHNVALMVKLQWTVGDKGYTQYAKFSDNLIINAANNGSLAVDVSGVSGFADSLTFTPVYSSTISSITVECTGSTKNTSSQTVS